MDLEVNDIIQIVYVDDMYTICKQYLNKIGKIVEIYYNKWGSPQYSYKLDIDDKFYCWFDHEVKLVKKG